MTITRDDIEHPDRETSAEAAGRHLREAFGKPDQHEANMREAHRLIAEAHFLRGKVVMRRAIMNYVFQNPAKFSPEIRESIRDALNAGMEAKP